ncbi:hypothetical protein CROQUDRAFT_653578 [Cronartium quercuum f. sp. fusiforme G11]|uniref:Uncharacterized protein n=1 Tax=Cronartium quercuum f. sp. fusiforme G11 TaxID=708437 RepID=A0A9P6TF91_9BASI|nr:hypothetical protein CROQUDRAFT_653578 [Cronartium quercuum f. sp. fusiforme G11]
MHHALSNWSLTHVPIQPFLSNCTLIYKNQLITIKPCYCDQGTLLTQLGPDLDELFIISFWST